MMYIVDRKKHYF